jgi:hypothetical protein
VVVLKFHVDEHHELIGFELLGQDQKRIERTLLIQRTELVLVSVCHNVCLGYLALPSKARDLCLNGP